MRALSILLYHYFWCCYAGQYGTTNMTSSLKARNGTEVATDTSKDFLVGSACGGFGFVLLLVIVCICGWYFGKKEKQERHCKTNQKNEVDNDEDDNRLDLQQQNNAQITEILCETETGLPSYDEAIAATDYCPPPSYTEIQL